MRFFLIGSSKVRRSAVIPGVPDKFLKLLKDSTFGATESEEVPGLLAHLPHASEGLNRRMDLLEDSQVSLVIFWKQKVSSENPLRKNFTAFLWPISAWERRRG